MHGSNSNLCIYIITINWMLLPLINCVSVHQCGVVRRPGPAARIVGGVAATQSQYPWMAMLLLDDEYRCDGTVIDHWHVITAAHCLEEIGNYTAHRNGSSGEITVTEYLETGSLKVIVGKHYYSTSVHYPGEQRVDVAAAIVHERYEKDAGLYSNDLAILRLARPLSFDKRVSPLCLPKPSTQLSDQCTVTGWGDTDGHDDTPSQLMAATMPAYNRSACVELQTLITDMKTYEIDLTNDLAEHTMCLASTKLKGETCFGDSGGPIFCLDPSSKHYELIGVVSWGYGSCPAVLVHPSVQTYVTPYLAWIQDTLNNLASPCATARCPKSSTCTEQEHTFECLCKNGLTGLNCDKCGQTLTNTQGSITSLNYPEDYHNRVDCEWIIVVPIRSIVNLTFHDMFVDDQESCDYYFIEIRRETAHGERLAKLCGSFVPAPIVSNTSLYVHFHSDISNFHRGFSAYYSVTGCSGHGLGENCTQNCSCVHDNTVSCDPFNGTCQCKAGWAGTLCADDVDECLSSCSGNNEVCWNYPGGFNCTCTEGTARNLSGHCAASRSIQLCDVDKVQQICNSSADLCVASTGQVLCMTRIVTKAGSELWLAVALTIGALIMLFLAALATFCIRKRTARKNVEETDMRRLVDNDELPNFPSWQLPTTYLLAGCGAVDKNTGPDFESQGVTSFILQEQTL